MTDSSPNAVEDDSVENDASTGDEPGGSGDEAVQPDREKSPDAPEEGAPDEKTSSVVRTALGALRAHLTSSDGDDHANDRTED